VSGEGGERGRKKALSGKENEESGASNRRNRLASAIKRRYNNNQSTQNASAAVSFLYPLLVE